MSKGLHKSINARRESKIAVRRLSKCSSLDFAPTKNTLYEEQGRSFCGAEKSLSNAPKT